MDPALYSELTESLYLDIEDMLDTLIDADEVQLDYESGSGVITIDCEETNSKVIISRQPPVHQIWVAARSGGFHCDYDDGVWRCVTTGETLGALLSRVCTEQSVGEVVFEGVA